MNGTPRHKDRHPGIDTHGLRHAQANMERDMQCIAEVWERAMLAVAKAGDSALRAVGVVKPSK